MPNASELLVRCFGCVAGCAVVVSSGSAAAQPATTPPPIPPATEPAGEQTTTAPTQPASDDVHDLPVVTERRGGFVIGTLVGPTLGWATGNPSDKALQNDPEYETETGLGFGYRVTPFLGGALTDWFTFGLGASFGSLSSADYSSGFGTFIFHVEAFPLYGQGGVYRDIGLAADFGAGSSTIRSKSPDAEVADSGVMSSVGLGAFWEPLRFWHFAGGPYVGYQRNWSRWYSRNDALIGLRLMFYGDQPM